MRCGFHLASLPHHDFCLVADALFAMGYRDVAVRVKTAWFGEGARTKQLVAKLSLLRESGLGIVIDGDGKFLVDPWDAAAPRLGSENQSSAREAMLMRLIEVANQVHGKLLTFSVGNGGEAEAADDVLKRIAESIGRLVVAGQHAEVALGIKPVIGSAIETGSHFRRLQQWLPETIAKSPCLGFAADISVMARRGELPIGDRLARDLTVTNCVYLGDIAVDTGGETRFGHGDLAIDRIVKSLEEMGYDGPLVLRCEGHGDAGLGIAAEAISRVTEKPLMENRRRGDKA